MSLSAFCFAKKRRRENFPADLSRHSLLSVKLYSSSPSCSAATAVSVPNNPCVSSAGPELKNNVFAGPAAAPFPNVSDHSPSIFRIESSGFFTNPMNLYVNPLNAAIHPLLKFPTRIVLLNSPKSRGVHTTPHGEFSHEPCSRCPICFPDGVKISTKPLPSPATSSCRCAFCL